MEITPNLRLRRKYALWVWTSAALSLPLALLALIPELGWTYLIIFVGVTLLWVLPTLAILGPYCRTIHYALTDDEVVVRMGLITKTEKLIPYGKITNIELNRGVFDRALGLGTLKIHTAGYSQEISAEAALAGLDDWEAVRRQVMARVHAREAKGEGAPRDAGGAAPAEATALQRDLLTELRAIRAAVERMRGW